MSQSKNTSFKKIFSTVALALICFACYSAHDRNIVASQTMGTQSGNLSEQQEKPRLLGKAFIGSSSKETVIEFKSEFDDAGMETLTVYVNGTAKQSIKSVANPQMLADFYDNFYGRIFVLSIASPASGPCGNSSFSVVIVDEKTTKIKISEPSEIKCQGESQDITISTKRGKGLYRQISIGKLNFNLEDFEWNRAKSGLKVK